MQDVVSYKGVPGRRTGRGDTISTESLVARGQLSEGVLGMNARLLRTWPLVSNASQSPVPVGSSPIDRHFHSPSARVRRLHTKYAIFCSGRVDRDFGDDDAGAKGANAEYRGAKRLVNNASTSAKVAVRTGVDGGNVLERTGEEHEDNTHAEYLHSSSGHVQHEGLHGEGLRWRQREIPCSLRLELLV